MVVSRAVNNDSFKVTTPSDQEIRLTRLFNAPRHLVFEAMTITPPSRLVFTEIFEPFPASAGVS